jgi:asparagine synthase (glutamine-hydrolysing)
VIRARKHGFGVDIGVWLTPLCVQLQDSLLGWSIFETGAPLQAGPVAAMLAEHLAGTANHGERLWRLLCLEIWWRLNVSRRARADAPLTAIFQ